MNEFATQAIFCLAAAVLALSSFPLAAQNSATANGGAGASMSAAGAQAGGSNPSSAAVPMRPVTGELQGNLDAKSAKPGEPVVLKTTGKMRTADGTELPKGTRLLGRVTQVQAHGKGHADSQLGLAFDRAELKDGRTFPIHATIESIAPSPSAMMAETMAGAGFAGAGGGMVGAGPAMAGGGGQPGGGTPAGAAMPGGAVGGMAGVGTRMGEGLGQAADGALGTAGHLAGDTAGMADASLHDAAGASQSRAAHATGIPGIVLSRDATGSASGMFSATHRNVHLDSGTQMVLDIATAN
ncbi:MAG: hypothetical protein ACLGSH_19825 [Acidobacteriota bacterium]